MTDATPIDSAVPGLVLEVVFDDEGPLTASWHGDGWWCLVELGEA